MKGTPFYSDMASDILIEKEDIQLLLEDRNHV